MLRKATYFVPEPKAPLPEGRAFICFASKFKPPPYASLQESHHSALGMLFHGVIYAADQGCCPLCQMKGRGMNVSWPEHAAATSGSDSPKFDTGRPNRQHVWPRGLAERPDVRQYADIDRYISALTKAFDGLGPSRQRLAADLALVESQGFLNVDCFRNLHLICGDCHDNEDECLTTNTKCFERLKADPEEAVQFIRRRADTLRDKRNDSITLGDHARSAFSSHVRLRDIRSLHLSDLDRLAALIGPMVPTQPTVRAAVSAIPSLANLRRLPWVDIARHPRDLQVAKAIVRAWLEYDIYKHLTQHLDDTLAEAMDSTFVTLDAVLRPWLERTVHRIAIATAIENVCDIATLCYAPPSLWRDPSYRVRRLIRDDLRYWLSLDEVLRNVITHAKWPTYLLQPRSGSKPTPEGIASLLFDESRSRAAIVVMMREFQQHPIFRLLWALACVLRPFMHVLPTGLRGRLLAPLSILESRIALTLSIKTIRRLFFGDVLARASTVQIRRP